MDQLPNRRPRRGTQTIRPSPPAICREPGGVPAAADHAGAKAMMLTRVADVGVGGQLELSHQVLPTGEAVVGIGGELDFATAETAVRYVSHVIDHHPGPVIADLAALRFCDAQGLSAIVRMAGYAGRAGRPFRLASPGPSVVKIMQITGLDRRFLMPPASCPPDS
jgi:anti-sigma B factor antagonist